MNLLQELLDVVAEENLATPAMLAQRLKVSQGLVELMLADLERAGYLRPATWNCTHCAGCGARQACLSPQPRFWIKTGK